jgi:GxxExxY protein
VSVEPQRRGGAKTVEPSPAQNEISRQIVDSAFTVHQALGPGLLESVYEQCLRHELATRGVAVQRQAALPLVYKGVPIEAGFRIDLIVERQIVVEVKTVERILPIHEAQLLTYLKLSSLPMGLLINFNVALIRDGIRRMVLTSQASNS